MKLKSWRNNPLHFIWHQRATKEQVCKYVCVMCRRPYITCVLQALLFSTCLSFGVNTPIIKPAFMLLVCLGENRRQQGHDTHEKFILYVPRMNIHACLLHAVNSLPLQRQQTSYTQWRSCLHTGHSFFSNPTFSQGNKKSHHSTNCGTASKTQKYAKTTDWERRK